MRLRKLVVAALAVAGVLGLSALIALPRYLPDDPKPVRFHRGTGQLTLTGDRDVHVELGNPPSFPYGVEYPSSSAHPLQLEFQLTPRGLLSLDIDAFKGAGSYSAVPDADAERRRTTGWPARNMAVIPVAEHVR